MSTPGWHGFVMRYMVSRHTELSLYVLSLSFVVTYLVNQAFSDFLLETTLVDSAGWLFLQLYLAGLFLVSLIAVLVPYDLKWYRSFVAPLLILISSTFLLFAYLQSLLSRSDTTLIDIFFILYHMLTMYVLFNNYMDHNPLNDAVISPEQASSKEVLLATLLAPVFICIVYLLMGGIENWAIPISLAMLLWASFDGQIFQRE